MRAFDFYAAKDSSEAVALLAQHGPAVKVLAGGTDLLADLKFASASHAPSVVVDISRADDLRGIETTAQGLRIGALVTHTEIMRSPVIQDLFPALVDAAHTIGAIVTIASPEGRRQLPLVEFFVGPRKTVLKPSELLADIIIPTQNVGKPANFLKFGLRKGQALALVNVAAAVWVDWEKNTFVAPRISLGAVAPTVIHASSAEKYL